LPRHFHYADFLSIATAIAADTLRFSRYACRLRHAAADAAAALAPFRHISWLAADYAGCHAIISRHFIFIFDDAADERHFR
jgi:hypothetical protein